MNPTTFRRAFTLVELMVAMVVTMLLIGLLVGIANFTTQAWTQGSDRAETSASARSALSLIGRELQGAVIDLDLGYHIRKKDENNYVLKFITRRQPTTDAPSGIQKVAYQLAWASHNLRPSISLTNDPGHPIPVLIRTVGYLEGELADIFNITGGNESWNWVNNWPTAADIDSEKTEVVADNVLGWRVNPVYLYVDPAAPDNENAMRIVVDTPGSNSGDFSFVDTTESGQPRYITSDLKYAKKVPELSSATSDSAPKAIEIQLATVPSSILPRLMQAGGMEGALTEDHLFKPSELSDSPFDRMLKKSLRIFDATYYLSSKTP